MKKPPIQASKHKRYYQENDIPKLNQEPRLDFKFNHKNTQIISKIINKNNAILLKNMILYEHS